MRRGEDKYPLQTMAEKINLSRIFCDSLVKLGLLKTFTHFYTPTVVYNLMSLLGSNIFNWDNLFDNLDVKSFLDDNFILPNEYTGFPFVDK